MTANEHKVFREITIYDAFLEVVGHKTLTLPEMRNNLWLTDDSNAEECLQTLVDRQLLVQQGDTYSPTDNEECQLLKQILTLALSSNIDYNFYLSDKVKALFSDAYGRYVFSAKQLSNSGTVRDIYKIVLRLCLDSLAVIFTYSPLTAKLTSNSFTEALCAYWHIAPHKHGLFERRVKSDVVITDLLEAQRKKDRARLIAGATNFFTPQDTADALRGSDDKLRNLLRFDVIPRNPDIFDSQQTEKTKKAVACVMKMVDSARQLNRQLIGTYHALSLFGNENPIPYRTYEVSVANNPGFKPTPAVNIEKAMQNMIENYKHDIVRANTIGKAFDLAAYVYSEIIYIQPYEDGNSRASMMALLHVLNLMKNGNSVFSPNYDFVIPSSYDIVMIQLTKGAAKRDDNKVARLLQDIYLNIINKAELKEMLEYR